MKKLIIILIALLLPISLFAGSVQDMHKAVIAKKNAEDGGGTVCDPASNEIGYTTIGSVGTPDIPAGAVIALLHTPDCAGIPYEAVLYNASATATAAKLCIYSDDGDSIPGASDLKIVCSDSIPSSSIGSHSDLLSNNSPSQLAVAPYWVVLAVDDSLGSWAYAYDANPSRIRYYSSTDTTFHDSPPANLGGTSLGSVSAREITIYATLD
jgi:hypothetical protein